MRVSSILDKARKGIRCPQRIFPYLYHNIYILPRYIQIHKTSHAKFLKNILGYCDLADFKKIAEEVNAESQFIDIMKDKYEEAGLPFYNLDSCSWPVTLYYFIRKLKPRNIVETGVFYGISSSYILQAMHLNQDGKLYSIDLPAYFETGGYYDANPYRQENERRIYLPKGKQSGFVVPDYLKKNWILRLGATEELLPDLLKELRSIEIFLHDSLHSYANMMFEFKSAYEYLDKGGFIFSDNIDWNTAYFDFCREYGIHPSTYLAYYESPRLWHNFGAIKKL
jgi:hypothetical protein